jgi:colicin import membrane protein
MGSESWLEAERTRIQQERDALDLSFRSEEVACYQRFAVTDCMVKIRAVRREAVADLRRQEISLNSTDAKRKAAEQIARIEEKSSLQAVADEAARVAEAQAAQAERQRVFDEKAAARVVTAADEAARLKEVKEREARRAEALADRAAMQSEAPAEQKKFDDKQLEAQQKKASNLKQQAQPKDPKVKPLPAQPAKTTQKSTAKPLPAPSQ